MMILMTDGILTEFQTPKKGHFDSERNRTLSFLLETFQETSSAPITLSRITMAFRLKGKLKPPIF